MNGREFFEEFRRSKNVVKCSSLDELEQVRCAIRTYDPEQSFIYCRDQHFRDGYTLVGYSRISHHLVMYVNSAMHLFIYPFEEFMTGMGAEAQPKIECPDLTEVL